MLSQFYQYGYQQPYYTPITPVAYNEAYANYELYPTQKVAYNEWDQYSHFFLQPIDQSMMPDTAIPGFSGLGQIDTRTATMMLAVVALILLMRKKKK